MDINDAIEIKKADQDSQYRLLPCKCGSDNVAYVNSQTDWPRQSV